MDPVHLRRLETAAPWPSALQFLEMNTPLSSEFSFANELAGQADKRKSVFSGQALGKHVPIQREHNCENNSVQAKDGEAVTV